jgi:hypothetical protein
MAPIVDQAASNQQQPVQLNTKERASLDLISRSGYLNEGKKKKKGGPCIHF